MGPTEDCCDKCRRQISEDADFGEGGKVSCNRTSEQVEFFLCDRCAQELSMLYGTKERGYLDHYDVLLDAVEDSPEELEQFKHWLANLTGTVPGN